MSATSPAITVPFLDLRATYVELQDEIDAALRRTMDSGWYLLGRELETFERQWAAYCAARHGLGVANGLDALVLALRALDIGPGDEVIVPSNTYIATWLAVSAVGARPVPVEPDERTWNIDPARAADAVTSRTRALLPVHLYGQPADLGALLALARSAGLRVLEDGAQAHGAACGGQRLGAHGDIVAWSFYPGKNLGAFGDGGAITTNDDALADRVRVLRNYGSRVKYVNEVQGVNSRLDELQAAVLAVKLAHLDAWNARRREQADRYTRALAGTPLALPWVPAWADPVWHLYVVRVPGGAPVRTRLQEHLAAQGVGTLIHYPIPPHAQAAYRAAGYTDDDFPIATRLAGEVLSLPIGPHLTRPQQDHIIEAILGFDAF
ncbi:MAG: DegT/DnrJ/EryC1/StrS family aminotransferase [Gemmatimonadaceae bacterium]|nr:DegT/DnrJ/EryC1/StrS family aminotransferase [Gemmatimonadaceae bacterium]